MVTETIALNGVTAFNAFGSAYTWNGAYIEAVYVENDGSVTNDVLNFNLSGAAWRIRRLALDNSSVVNDFDVNITDANDGIMRRIDWIQLQDNSDTTITLFNSRVRFIDGGEGGTVTLNLGAQNVNIIGLYDVDAATVNIGSGSINALYFGSGTNVFNGGAGFVNLMQFDDGSTNTITNGGNFGAIRVDNGTNNFTFANGGDLLSLGHGISNVTLNGGFFGSITSYSGTNTITVNANAEVRSIGFSDGVDILTIFGRVEQIQVGDNNDRVSVGLGGEVEVVNLSGGNNFFRTTGDYVGAVHAYSGHDTMQFAAGSTDQAYAGGGNNIITVGTDYFLGSLRANEGNDRLTVSSGGEIGQASLGEGNNTITMRAGSQIDSLIANGNETISLTGDARILQLKMDDGVNRLTTQTGFMESIFSHNSQNILNLGTGGAGQILFTGSATAQSITSAGWIGSLQIYAGNQVNVQATTVVLGAGGGGYIQTSKGNDNITTGTGFVDHINTYDGNDRVTIGSGEANTIATGIGNDTVDVTAGRVDYLETGEGNDVVTLGARGARFVALEGGDDTISLTRSVPNFGIEVQGGDGIDTLDLSRYATPVTLSLNESGWQNPADPLLFGYLAVIEIENLTGTASADNLEGNDDANTILGGAGHDSISGLGGADRLVGDRGNDTLTGGLGNDVFVFAPGGNSDRITDFTLGQDKIELLAATALGDLTFTTVGVDVRVTFGTLNILVEDTTLAQINAASNFLF